MFKSIRWRFILIYFLLVFLAMSIVGVFIVTRLEQIQMEMSSSNMNARIKSLLEILDVLNSEDDWSIFSKDSEGESREVGPDRLSTKNNLLRNVQIGYNENLYIILNDDKKIVIDSNIEDAVGYSAYNLNKIDNSLLLKSSDGSVSESVPQEYEGGDRNKHMCYPVMRSDNTVKGYIYLTNSIQYIYDTVSQSKKMMTQATAIALSVTVVLGLILARSITGPIKDLTVKAKLMSEGDFDQKVEVKSNDEIGQLGNMFNYLIDELKKSMSKLHQEKSKLETTFKYMADGILTVDTDGGIIHINPVAKSILSIEDDGEIYDDVMERIGKDLKIVDLRSKDWHGTDTLEMNGEIYKIDFAPFMDNKNETGGVILVFKNATEQVRMEKMQREFVANVSHELKTPITTIKSYAETLLDGAMEDKGIAGEFLNVINSESDRMARLVSDLLKLSRMDYDKANWSRELLDVGEMLKDVHKKLYIHAQSKDIELILKDMTDDMAINFDRDGFEQIMLNIVGNAVKYTSEHGHVTIDAKRDGKNIVISVKDDGIGIPKKDLARVFDRFYRVDKARTRQMGGTGLGLSIARQIAEAHNSTIEAVSEVGKGTEMIISIPEAEK